MTNLACSAGRCWMQVLRAETQLSSACPSWAQTTLHSSKRPTECWYLQGSCG